MDQQCENPHDHRREQQQVHREDLVRQRKQPGIDDAKSRWRGRIDVRLYRPSRHECSFLELRKISINETLADHLEYLFVESQYSELPGLAGIATPEAMAKKIEVTRKHSTVSPTIKRSFLRVLEAPTESIDLVELSRNLRFFFNLEFGRAVDKMGTRSPRRWTEIELTIGTDIQPYRINLKLTPTMERC